MWGAEFGERFRVGHWWSVVNANTEHNYEVALGNLKSAWAWKPSVINYVETTWLNPHKTKFAKAWTNNVLHFGNTTTCRVESAHAALKAWLQTSTCALDTLFARVNLFIDSQMIKIRDSLEKSRGRIGRQHMIDPFRHLVGHVSHYCLNMLKMENTKRLTMGREVFDYCGCVLVSSFGIPCACAIQLAINENGGLYLDDIHFLQEFGGYSSPYSSQLHPEDEGVQEPHVVTSTRGRPPGSTSTRRDPSGFEHAQHEFRDRSRSRSRTRTTTTTRSTRDGDSSAANPSTRTSGDRDSNATRTFEPERFERRADPFPYADNVPDIIIPFIVGWNDVLGDGNCGFRCVADAFNGGEDRWPHARQHLYNEISMKKIYRMFMEDESTSIEREFVSCTPEVLLVGHIGWSLLLICMLLLPCTIAL
ncbi:uncharacterized protein LOC125495024 [Beta vulgaris subsp. vulgaris]|uniref:uncharacterized protein LOC125495024 n=1 Tax=Beta vulgaris subsp. vulgaris TaxID=3555 RepID=UPI002548BAEF|nr:uncharacterized protein LOC125495024 [Beta vulgaris subsp. vulgaris]